MTDDYGKETMTAWQSPPRGRPPKGYIWSGACYVHRDSLEPFERVGHEAAPKEIWRQARIARYAADKRGIRTKHRDALARSRRSKGAQPRRKKLENATLDLCVHPWVERKERQINM